MHLSVRDIIGAVITIIVSTALVIAYIQNRGHFPEQGNFEEKPDPQTTEKLNDALRKIDRMYDLVTDLNKECQRVVDDDVLRRRLEHR